jgi:DNA-binding response OmpR family regulator
MKILIVDDEQDALSILEKELAGRGYSVISADNGNDAINLAKSEHPDLIILDIWMSGMDGAKIIIFDWKTLLVRVTFVDGPVLPVK